MNLEYCEIVEVEGNQNILEAWFGYNAKDLSWHIILGLYIMGDDDSEWKRWVNIHTDYAYREDAERDLENLVEYIRNNDGPLFIDGDSVFDE